MTTIHFFNEIFNNITENISILNENEETLFVNTAFLSFTGYSLMEIIDKNYNLLSFCKNNYTEKYNKIKLDLNNNKLWEGELWFENKTKSKLLPVSCRFCKINCEGKDYILETFVDITDINKHKKYIKFLKYYNEFLNLPNQNFLKEKIKNKLKLKEKFSIILITVTNLKNINDTFGREIGNKFLVKFSKQLKTIIADYDSLLFYLEGNQFVIIFHSVDKETIVSFTEQISSLLISKPFNVDGNEVAIEAYLGGYIVEKNEDYSSILHKLFIANEEARNTSSKKLFFYSQKIKDKIITRFKVESLIKNALKNDLFLLYYQPKVNFANKIESVEALIRMKSEGTDLIYPNIFIPVAEESNLINEIGDWVFRKVIEDSRYITMKSGEKVKFSFNVSASQFSEYNFLDKLKKSFNFSQDFDSSFEIEITESAIMEDFETSIKKMFKLKELGFDLGIDDFGTGYSSLAYLKEFPISFLKIDKSFTDGIPHDKKTVSIVKSIIYLAKQLDLKITAEGVEHAEQFSWYKDNHCDEVQGYYFSKPVTKEELIKLLKIYNNPSGFPTYIKWEDKFSTGISAFDSHHMIILNILNTIYDDIHNKKLTEKTDLKQFLGILLIYIDTHFKEEEKYLFQNNTPNFKEHLKEHKEFKKKIIYIKESFTEGKEKLDYELFGILKDWFQNHILKYDQNAMFQQTKE
jgi:hemerythrin-like metal-binding protein/diguanylate cyclase (GGDEF)-like protein/PAS domain S-box-containing protein